MQKSTTPRIILALSSFLIAGLLFIGIEFCVGLFHPMGIAFPPRFSLEYQTTEFTSRVTTNSLGFRDREFATLSKARFRCLAIGDSFTFGWGVGELEAWPKALEGILRSQGYNVEIANLGQPGANSPEYEQIAQRAIPLLQPNLVLVGVLQGDDLARAMIEPKPDPSLRARVSRFLRSWFPNLMHLRDLARKPEDKNISAAELKRTWQQQTQKFLSGVGVEEKARFHRLDSFVHSLYLNGDLNPYLVEIAIRHPEYYQQTALTNTPQARVAIRLMAEHLAGIRRIAEKYGAKVVVAAVPNGVFSSGKALKAQRRVGFILQEELLTSEAPDTAIRQAAELAGLPFLSVTAGFRDHAQRDDSQELFFPLDGHLTPSGHRLYAELLAPTIARDFAHQ